MGLFNKMLGKKTAAATAKTEEPVKTASPVQTDQVPKVQAVQSDPAAARVEVDQKATAKAEPTLKDFDVFAVLAEAAGKKRDAGNYKISVVDLLKLLELDSSLAAREKLAEKLNVHVGAHGSAEQNAALHTAIIQKLSENEGRVSAGLKV